MLDLIKNKSLMVVPLMTLIFFQEVNYQADSYFTLAKFEILQV